MKDLENKNNKRALNSLRISNLDGFFEIYSGIQTDHLSPWQVFACLENKIKYCTELPKVIQVEYKEGGEVLFEFEGDRIENGLNIVEYRYWSTAS